MMSIVMQTHREVDIRLAADDDLRPQLCVLEMPLLLCIALNHPGHWVVDVLQHVHIVDRTQMEIPQFMAGRDRGQQHVFWVPTIGIAAKGRVGAAEDLWLAQAFYSEVPLVGRIAGSTFTRVSRPVYGNSVCVFFHRSACVVKAARKIMLAPACAESILHALGGFAPAPDDCSGACPHGAYAQRLPAFWPDAILADRQLWVDNG